MTRSIGSYDPAQEALRYSFLYRVTILGLVSLYYTDHDTDIVYDSQTWKAAPGITRSPVSYNANLQIDDMRITVPNVDLTLFGATKKVAAWARMRTFDDAEVRIYQYDHTTGTAFLHSVWNIQGVERANTDQVTFILESCIAKLDRLIPRVVFQPECNNALFDSVCAVDESLFSFTSTVVSATQFDVTYSALSGSPPAGVDPIANDYFTFGVIVFTGGVLQGRSFFISAHTGDATGGTVTLATELPAAPASGDPITLKAGCAKTIAHCKSKFGNYRTVRPDWRQHYRGFPYMPSMEETLT